MDLDAGARGQAGRAVLLWWYAAYLAAAVAAVLWYLAGLSPPADGPCDPGDFWCGDGTGSLVVLLVVIGVPLLAGCLAVSWVLLGIVLPRVSSAALAGSLAAVAGPVLLALLGYGLLHAL